MNKRKFLGMLLLLVLLSGVILASIASVEYVQNMAFSKVQISIEDPSKQGLTTEKQLKNTVLLFLEQQGDSVALNTDAFLLETSVKALPYVKEAQVYWNMNSSLVVEVTSKTAVALAYAGENNYFITSNNEVLKQPKGKWLDLPVITGTTDSSMIAKAGMMLQKMSSIVHENSIAQLAVDSGIVELVPRAYQHVAKAHGDERLDGELKKLAAYYVAHTEEELKEIKRIDLRYKNQVVTTSR
ncbi:MAG TPA: hypothetical protein DIT65_07965 [Cryomorphaceae bacterium]|nr:hypothetical protein [Cryomorphaceae bacterium]